MKITKRQLKRIIKEEVKKHQLEGYEEAVEESDAGFEQLLATWDTKVNVYGNPSWTKKYKSESALGRSRFRSAHVSSDPDASKFEWVVFESVPRGDPRDEDIVDDDIGQGTETSLRDAILAADKVLVTGR